METDRVEWNRKFTTIVLFKRISDSSDSLEPNTCFKCISEILTCRSPAADSEMNQSSGLKALVVDDDSMVRRACHRMLLLLGFQVTEAGSQETMPWDFWRTWGNILPTKHLPVSIPKGHAPIDSLRLHNTNADDSCEEEGVRSESFNLLKIKEK